MKYENFKGFQDEDADLSVLMDSQGRHRTASLFNETVSMGVEERYPPLYTLRNRDYKDLPSAYLIYMSSVDEFDAAMKLVGSMSHWRKLLDTKWFMEGGQSFEGLTVWREDMAARDMSTAKRQLVKSAGQGDVSSARKLFDISSSSKDAKKAPGRPPTKADKKAAEEEAQLTEEEKMIEKIHSQTFGEENGED